MLYMEDFEECSFTVSCIHAGDISSTVEDTKSILREVKTLVSYIDSNTS
jgi:hypothetical protein